MSRVLVQTGALTASAYRELHARKLFWFTLALSGLVVACFAALGINKEGVTILWWTLEVPGVNTSTFSEATFYKLLFVSLGISIWLSWVAVALALISTSTIFPELVAGGSIDVVLSKPISRLRLFLTTYVLGLLFVALQVTVFCLASFLVIGVRGGAWEPGLFLAVPVVLAMFSYLYAVLVLCGVVTRSAIAALLLTALFWLLLFMVNTAENILLMPRISAEVQVEELTRTIARLEERAAAEPTEFLTQRIKDRTSDLREAEASLPTWKRWHGILFAVKTVLPKTSETVNLLSRALISAADLPDVEETAPPVDDGPFGGGGNRRLVQERMQEVINSRSVWWVLGTSLLFEACVVGVAATVFCRRDF